MADATQKYLKLSGFNLVTIYSSSIKIGANPSKSTCKNIGPSPNESSKSKSH